MQKKLKPYTIIPQDLYVERDADRQVISIINDMGRPGYVLVSRQMGKTNLLLNAKRNLQTSFDAFVYVDLSNSYNDAKSCFENIIDTAIETNEEKFCNAKEIILSKRKEIGEIPAHKQHNNELRILLKALDGGKLVIILDEIDALTKTGYSDQIFAQIRSSYFAGRANFTEFYNLTYLLSGVVEPTEIIKDPKISPFNIGQKIFLNDFSKIEFDELLMKSNLSLPNEISERIFYWTNGNPRMTWDLCSEVENVVEKENLTPQLVDKIVVSNYLTTFDKPPIDHIRELVRLDRDLRNSIVEIEYKKGKEISPEIKSKLYLTGIINYNEHDVNIKNEIIRQSLSLDWIKSLEAGDKHLLTKGIELFQNHQPAQALECFEELLKNEDFLESQEHTAYFYMGQTYFELKNYPKAIECYNKAVYDIDETPKYHFLVENLKASAYKEIKEYPRSSELYKYVIENSKKDENYIRAKINLGQLYMNKFLGETIEESKKIFEEIVSNQIVLSDKISEEDVNDYKCLAYCNLSEIALLEDNISKAQELLIDVLPSSTSSTKPIVLLQLAYTTKNNEEKSKLVNEVLACLENGSESKSIYPPEKFMKFDFAKLTDVLIHLYEFDKAEFKKVDFKLKGRLEEKTYSQQLYDIALFAIRKGKWNVGEELLSSIVEENDLSYSDGKGIIYQSLEILAYSNDYSISIEYPSCYIQQFKESEDFLPDVIDFEIFSTLTRHLLEVGDPAKALMTIKIINAKKAQVPENLLNNYLLIDHLEVNALYLLEDDGSTFLKANNLLYKIKNRQEGEVVSNLLGDSGLNVIKENAESILRNLTDSERPKRQLRNHDRNKKVTVKYKDGTTAIAKYKKVEKDVLSGKCVILE